jgi:hypothetical protein
LTKKLYCKNTFKAFIFLGYTQLQRILSKNNSTAMHKFLNTLHPGGIRAGIFGSVGGRDDHFATPSGCHQPVPHEETNGLQLDSVLVESTF